MPGIVMSSPVQPAQGTLEAAAAYGRELESETSHPHTKQ
jgi:hypothetical protein